jgi:hypothetical protein
MKRVALIAGVLALVAALVVPVTLARATSRPASNRATPVPTSAATIVRTDLTTTTQAAGTLAYAGSYQIVNQTPGRVITALPAVGDLVGRGAALYEVDGIGVPLLYGSRPMWRDLHEGVAPGPDVRGLNDNLLALGFTDRGYLVAGDQYTSRTAAAVDAWQRSLGRPASGVVRVGDVVLAPDALRISALEAAVGAPAEPGELIAQATSTRQVVEVEVPVTEEYLVRPGDAVTVTLPDGKATTPGTVYSIGAVASAPPAASGPGSPTAGNAGPNDQIDNVTVTVVLRDPAIVAGYTNAAVTVNVTSAHVRDVLAVPVNALVALAEGGDAVEVIDGTQHRLVAVRTGLFANSLVEISGRDIAAGMHVEVPTS